MEQFRWENSWILVLVAWFDLFAGGGVTFLPCNAYDLRLSDTISLYLLYTICIGVIGLLFMAFLMEVQKTPRNHSERVKHLICGLTLGLWIVLCVLLCYQVYSSIVPSTDSMMSFMESLALLSIRLIFVVLEGLIYHLKLRKRLWSTVNEPISTQSSESPELPA
jgi:hypothetical protein